MAKTEPFPYERALVTGASSGIGRSFAAQLAARGVGLVLTARRETALKELARGLEDRHGISVQVLAADLCEESGVAAVERRLADPDLAVDLLVNNAGASGAPAALGSGSLEGELANLTLNTSAPLRLMHACLPRMRSAGRGAVVNVSSMVSALPMPGSSVYGASKAFLSALGESLYLENAPHGVHVMTLSAGLTRTEFHTAAGIDTEGLPKVGWLSPDEVADESLRALARRRITVVPGAFNKFQGSMMAATPRTFVRAMVGRMYRP